MIVTTVFLVSMVFTGSGSGTFYKYFPMEDMKTCLVAVEKARIDISEGGDAEGGAVLFCTNGKEVE